MGAEQLRSLQMHEQIVTAKAWVRDQVKLVEGHLPVLLANKGDNTRSAGVRQPTAPSWHRYKGRTPTRIA